MRWPGARVSRDSVLFGAGLLGIGYETIRGGAEPTLIVAFVGMLGSPLFLRTDETRRASAAAREADTAAAARAAEEARADAAFAGAAARAAARAAASEVPP